MTDEELAAIRARWFTASEHGPELMRPPTQAEMALDVHILLAEIERLRAVERTLQFADSPEAQAAIEREHERWMAENAAMREIVQAVANYLPLRGHTFDCVFCGIQPFKHFPSGGILDAGWEHAPDCPCAKAWALLASETPD